MRRSWSSASPWAGPSHCPASGPLARPVARPVARPAARPASRSSAEVGGGPASSPAPSPAAWPPLCARAQRGPVPLSAMPSRILERPSFDIPGGRHKLNPSQTTAVREALQKQFAVIQGPPGEAHVGAAGAGAGCRGLRSPPSLPAGTGKTVVGFHIVFWLHKFNEELACGAPCGGPCILYCGPSNKSVDVVAGVLGRPCGALLGGAGRRGRALTRPLPPGLLLSRRAELKPLRVYSEQAEATEFPVPGVGSRGLPRKTPREGRPNPELRCASRMSGCVCVRVEVSGLSCPNGRALGRDDTGPDEGVPLGASPCTTGSGRLPTPTRPTLRPLTPSCRKERSSPRRTLTGE